MLSKIKKSDSALQIIYAEVYVPDVPDSDGEFMSKETVRVMAHDFMRKSDMHAIDMQHENERVGATVVESFIAREGDEDFIPNAWVAGIHIPSKSIWKMIEAGEINGLSLEALVSSQTKEVELEVPSEYAGKTEEDSTDHVHEYYLELDDEGNIIKGHTSKEAGHSHLIKRATVTEPSDDDEDDHTHRFSYMEGLNIA